MVGILKLLLFNIKRVHVNLHAKVKNHFFLKLIKCSKKWPL